MRVIAIAAGVAGTLGLAACASTAPGEGSYAEQYARMNAECVANGGMLTPIAGSSGAGVRPSADYACDIRGGPSDRLRGDRD